MKMNTLPFVMAFHTKYKDKVRRTLMYDNKSLPKKAMPFYVYRYIGKDYVGHWFSLFYFSFEPIKCHDEEIMIDGEKVYVRQTPIVIPPAEMEELIEANMSE